MGEDSADCEYECLCTNIAIMQLFHELKQKFPYVPDRVVNECIRKNGHDKGACEWALEKENRAYLLHSYPPGLCSRMSSEENFRPVDDGEGCCRNIQSQDDHSQSQVSGLSDHPRCDFDRRIPGRQSLDSLCRRHRTRKCVTFKHYSDEFLNQPSSKTANVSHVEEGFRVLRLPNATSDDSNLSRTNNREVREHEGKSPVIRNRCLTASHDRQRLLNRPSSLVDESAVGGSEASGVSDLMLEFASDLKSCRCKRTSVSVVSSCSVETNIPPGPHSAPVTPCGCQIPLFPPLSLDITTPSRPKRTTLNIEPSPPYMAQFDSPSPRSFTSVNLTLRPPSSDPQPPIDIRSSAGGGLTYSTCSYDPRQGYQSHLSISIGPGGQGSVSAARTKTLAPVPVPASENTPHITAAVSSLSANNMNIGSTTAPEVFVTPTTDGPASPRLPSTDRLNPTTEAVVNEQLIRKQRLEKELEKEKEKVRKMQRDIDAMERDLNYRQSRINRHSKVQELKEEIDQLSTECKRMMAEVDCFASPDTDDDSPGDSGVASHTQDRVQRQSSNTEETEEGDREGIGAASGSDGPNWICYLCTFRNHPLLVACEQCEMPRGVIGPTMRETQNIHIHVTHHNFPSRRIAHSWVV